jgi:hypothetical protein
LAKTIGFFQNFNLRLDRLSSALHCVRDNPEANYATLAECMGVNTPVAEGYSAWLRHTGLVEATSGGKWQALRYSPTPWGALALEYDPTLSDLGTQWLLHYYLATEHSERSDAWHVLINHFISPGLSFTSEQFQRYFTDTFGKEVTNRSALQKDPQVALSTYVHAEALGKLGILSRHKGIYTVGRPALPDALIVGYVLFDRWQQAHSDTDTLRFSLLCQEPGNVGRIFLAEPLQIRTVLADLAGRGYLTFAETQHEPVNRLYHGAPATLLERYYQQR